MKRLSLISIIAMVLAVVMCVTLVSCDDSHKKPTARTDIVDEVTSEIDIDIYTDAFQFARMLAEGTDHHEIEEQMSNYYYKEYGDIRGYIYVYGGKDDDNSIMVRMGADEEDLNEDVNITNIILSGADNSTSADFTLSYSGYFEDKPSTMKVEGKFTLGGSKESIVLSSVVFNNVDYDVDNFNEELENMLKEDL